MSHSTKRFRCIALDAVGTLIYAEPAVATAYAEFGRQFGSRLTPEQVQSRFAAALRRADELAMDRFGETGRTSEAHERHFWQTVVLDVLPDVTDPTACFQALFAHFARPEAWRCFPDVAPALNELEQRGYSLVVASNFDARLHRVCDGLAGLRRVRQRVISSLVGYRKSHRGFYDAVVVAGGCAPSEVLMIGDDFANDVVAARAAGLAAIHLRRGDRTAAASEFPAKGGNANGLPEGVSTLVDLLEWLP